MSESNVIKQNNGICVKANSNFASRTTCDHFLMDTLQVLKTDPKTSEWFLAENGSRFETNILPVVLMNLASLSSDKIKKKENFASNRAEYEVKKFVAKFYNHDDPASTEFIKTFQPAIIDAVKRDFTEDSKKNIKILSQTSFMRLNQAMVNILLKKKPDGSDNIVRRVKQKEDSLDYYTKEEIEEGERMAYSFGNADNFINLDVEYVPFTNDFFLLSTATMISVKRSIIPFREVSLEEIFNDKGVSPDVANILKQIKEIAVRDLGIISIIEDRHSDIIDLIHKDYNNIEVTPNENNDNLTMKEKYTTILLYITKIIVFLAEKMISITKDYAEGNSNKSIKKLIGIEEDDDSFMYFFNKMLTFDESNPNFGMNTSVYDNFLSKFPFMFKISEHLFIVLMVNLIKKITNNYGSKTDEIMNPFLNHIGYNKPNPIYNLITIAFGRFNTRVKTAAIENVPGLINIFKGSSEPIVSYAYRNVTKYMTEFGKFSSELAIIDSSLKYSEYKKRNSVKNPPKIYSMVDNDVIFSVDSLVETVNQLSGYKVTDSDEPYKSYKSQIIKKQQDLAERRAMISDSLDKKFGKSFSKYYVNIPRIPYNINEQIWASEKCFDLELKIAKITSQSTNSDFDWDNFRNVFRNVVNLTNDFAESEYESPEMITAIEDAQENYNQLCSECGIDDSFLEKLKKYESDLNFYQNLDKIKFDFEPFEFKFKKNLENVMSFHIGKSFILYNNFLRSVKSIVQNTTVNYENILRDYFTPFFEPFVTINKDVFDISFQTIHRENTKTKTKPGLENSNETITEVIMTVCFGSSDDIHVASKFRTKFPCILNSERMLFEAKHEMGISEENTDFQLSDIDSKFIISWAKSDNQRKSLSGTNNESIYKLIDDTIGCDEAYPFYDNIGMSSVTRNFQHFSSRYRESIERKRYQEAEKKKRIEAKERKEKGIEEEPKIQFAERSNEAEARINYSVKLWKALDINGDKKDAVSSLVAIAAGNKQSGDARNLGPFSGKKLPDRRVYGQSNINRKVGEHELINNQPSDIKYKTLTKTITIKEKDNDGFITERRKTIQVIKNEETRFKATIGGRSVRAVNQSISQRFPTPHKFSNGIIHNDNRSRSTTRGNRSTPINYKSTSRSRGTPGSASNNSRSSTPSFQTRNRNTASPSSNKRSGYQVGAQSPQETTYLQPDHSAFINAQSVGLGFYPNIANSPIGNESRQLFEDVEPPSGVFIEPIGNNHNNGTDRSNASNLTGTSHVVTSTPQYFNNVDDDDFDI
jgi:hypothetical protein